MLGKKSLIAGLFALFILTDCTSRDKYLIVSPTSPEGQPDWFWWVHGGAADDQPNDRLLLDNILRGKHSLYLDIRPIQRKHLWVGCLFPMIPLHFIPAVNTNAHSEKEFNIQVYHNIDPDTFSASNFTLRTNEQEFRPVLHDQHVLEMSPRIMARKRHTAEESRIQFKQSVVLTFPIDSYSFEKGDLEIRITSADQKETYLTSVKLQKTWQHQGFMGP